MQLSDDASIRCARLELGDLFVESVKSAPVFGDLQVELQLGVGDQALRALEILPNLREFQTRLVQLALAVSEYQRLSDKTREYLRTLLTPDLLPVGEQK